MKWVSSCAVDFLTRFWTIFGDFFPKKSDFDQKNRVLTEFFFSKIKFETSSGVSKNKIWDILGNFGHNLAAKKGREKEVYCRF